MDKKDVSEVSIDPRKYRKLRGMRTQERQAQLLGTTVSAISNIERGRSKPTGEQLLRALLIAGASPWDVLAEETISDLKRLIAELPEE